MPKPDFAWATQICCTHSKWYEVVSELEDIPFYCIDIGAGAGPPFSETVAHRIEYIAGQLLDGIEWLQKVTERPFDDEKFIQGCKYTMNGEYKWAKVCELNQNVPAPLDEKTMFSLYVMSVLHRARKEVSDFYDELYEEVEDRVKRGIAAVGNERLRLMTDSQPPWAFLDMWRTLEREYGAVSIGSLYTFSLTSNWDMKGGKFVAKEPLDPGNNRESACRALAEWYLFRPIYQNFYHSDFKSKQMIAIARQWKVQGVISHLNTGCEGSSLGVLENKIALNEAGFPVLTIQGNMGDEAATDKVATYKRIEAFMEDVLGVKKVAAATK